MNEEKEYVEFKLVRNDIEISMKFGVHSSMDELYENMKDFASSLGYAPETVRDYFDPNHEESDDE